MTVQQQKSFFAKVQNKLHFAIHGNTAAELVMKRANSDQDNMGLTSWQNSPKGKVVKTDVSIAKNYLKEQEIKSLDRFVTMYFGLCRNSGRKKYSYVNGRLVGKTECFHTI